MSQFLPLSHPCGCLIGVDDTADSPKSVVTDLWGKSHGLPAPYPLLAHLLDTAAAADVICDWMLPAPMREALGGDTGFELWKSETVLLAGWHDIGKASCGFQQQVPAACPEWLGEAKPPERLFKPPGVRGHVLDSYYLAWDALAGLDYGPRVRAAQIVGGHHGVIPPHEAHRFLRRSGAQIVDGAGGTPGELASCREELLDTVSGITGASVDVQNRLLAPAAMSLAVMVLADWLVSNTRFIERQAEAISRQDGDWAAHYARAGAAAAEDLQRVGLMPPRPQPGAHRQVLRDGSEPRGLQRTLLDAPARSCGITVIGAPTGEGKTEAALIAASMHGEIRASDGWYFAMPTTGTADGLVDRLRQAIARISGGAESPSLRLIHGLSRLRQRSDDYQAAPDEAAGWMNGKKGLLAPYGVGTIDQMLMGVLTMKHSPLRMLACGTRTVIIDEAHCFDPYTRWLMNRCVEWLGALRAPVIVLSATLPKQRSDELIRSYQKGCGAPEQPPKQAALYPGWVRWRPDAPEDGFEFSPATEPSRRWQLEIEVRDSPQAQITADIASAAVAAADPEGCVMVVRASIAAAQQTYEAVRALLSADDCEVVLLHSRFRHRDRRRIADGLISRFGPDGTRPRRMILVATQIVEMSLDVDFDVLITDPAPVGAVLQRAGRIHRHAEDGGEKRPRHRPAAHSGPKALLFWPVNDDGRRSFKQRVYQEHDLRQTDRIFGDGLTVAIPGDVPGLVDEADKGDHLLHCAPESADPEAKARWDAYAKWASEADVDRRRADISAIPEPHRRADPKALALLTSPQDDEIISGTRLGRPTRLVLPVYETDGGYSADGCGGKPLPAEPSQEQEHELFMACVPVTDYGSGSTGWLTGLDKASDIFEQAGDERAAAAWRRGPLAQARLLPMQSDIRARLSEWSVTVRSTAGLSYARERTEL